MYALTSSMKGTTCRRFANIVFKKTYVKVCNYPSHSLNMKKIRVCVNLPFQASSVFSENSRRNLNPRTRNMSATAASFVGDNTSATTATTLQVADSGSSGGVARIGEVKKETKIETNVSVKINLNGSGDSDSDSGIPFIDEMLHEFASHGLFDVHVKATGDIDVDKCRTNEDVAHAIGTALKDAVGDKKDIKRFGSYFAPHHEVLIQAAIDLSGHSHLQFDCDLSYYSETELLEPFFESLVKTSGMTLHLRRITGRDSRHIIEATFKAFAGALRQAIEYDPRRRPLLLDGSFPTSK